MRQILTLCLVAAFFTIKFSPCLSLKANFIDKIGAALKFKKYSHSVVIDAGISSFRAYVYTYISDYKEKSAKLFKERFVEVKPGLLSYALDSPTALVEPFKELFMELQRVLPVKYWPETTLSVYGGSGYETSLPNSLGHTMMYAINMIINNTTFLKVKSVATVLKEAEESFFNWFSLNLLMGRFALKSTLGVLGLQGHTAQVAFVPSVQAMQNSNFHSVYKLALYGSSYNLFSHGERLLGLNAARLAILKYKPQNSTTLLRSHCISPNVNTQWTYRAIPYQIKGVVETSFLRNAKTPQIPLPNYLKCEEAVRSVVSKFGKTPNLSGQKIFAINNYFDLAYQTNLIGVRGGEVQISKIMEHAKSMCQSDNFDAVFTCLDFTYISVLLTDHYGFRPSDYINIVQNVKGHTLNWCLSASFIKAYVQPTYFSQTLH